MRAKEAIFVVGCGSIGRRHIRNLRALGVANVLAYDLDPKSLAQAVAESNVAPVDSLESGLKVRPKAVLVCTPPHRHTEVAGKAVEAGAHVFVEKPIAHATEGVADLLGVAQIKGLVFMVGYNLRFHAAVQKVKAVLDAGAVGRVMTVRAEYGQYLPDWRPGQDYRKGYIAREDTGGGILLDGSHELDYVRWLAGEVKSVYCVAGKMSELEMEAEDTALVVMKHQGGAVSEVHLDCTQRGYARGCKVVGTKGTVAWDITQGVKLVGESREYETVFPLRPTFDLVYVEEMKHFLACIRREAVPPVTGTEGLRVLELALAARQSARTHQEVAV
jgi:predicted dehydrogenase